MSDDQAVVRSPEMMCAGDTALLIIDVQEKLAPHIQQHDLIAWNICRLIEGASALDATVAATEQYPKGLGPTIPEVSKALREAGVESIPEKISFSCAGCGDLFGELKKQGVFRLLVAGFESHVCVQQTVLDALSSGFRTYVAVDAIGARYPVDHEFALRRMETSGAILTTCESALCELCETAGSPQFKKISDLLKKQRPT